MAEERAGTAKIPKTAEETHVLDDEELARIVGGAGNSGNNDDDDDGDGDGGGLEFGGVSIGPDWSSDG